jgi:hypothetical protein
MILSISWTLMFIYCFRTFIKHSQKLFFFSFIKYSLYWKILQIKFVDFNEIAFYVMYKFSWSWGSSVSIMTDYGLDDWDSIPSRDKAFFFWPLYPDQLWGPPSLLSNRYWVSFSHGKAWPKNDIVYIPIPYLVLGSWMNRNYKVLPLLHQNAFMVCTRDSFNLTHQIFCTVNFF